MFRPLLTILAVIAITAYSSPGVFRYSRLQVSLCDTFNAKYTCPLILKFVFSSLGIREAHPTLCGLVSSRCSPEEIPCAGLPEEDLKSITDACAQVSGGGTTARPSPTEEAEHTTASPPTPTPETEEPPHTTLPDPGIPDSDHTTASPPTGTTEDNSIHTTGTPPTPTPEPEEQPHTTLPDPGIPDSDHTTASPPTGTTEDNSIHTTGTPPTPTPEPEELPHTTLASPEVPW
ncbi:hypothetical protein CRE_09025 [Caenorhabditis remanei]|uniref:Uncharacterized protein n=1 Tax=Caenorhabditis remanei TaxID=31234 RepID=E3LIV2_CAERE|nr:hypothetical protein CRE_09025 [Caenorhabditis remanei]